MTESGNRTNSGSPRPHRPLNRRLRHQARRLRPNTGLHRRPPQSFFRLSIVSGDQVRLDELVVLSPTLFDGSVIGITGADAIGYQSFTLGRRHELTEPATRTKYFITKMI